jgi:hypothetical protein
VHFFRSTPGSARKQLLAEAHMLRYCHTVLYWYSYRTSLRKRSSRSSATRAAVTSVPTKRESGSTKARMSALVLGGPPARTTKRRPRPRRRAPPGGSGLQAQQVLARTAAARPQRAGVAPRRGGRQSAPRWPPRAMACSSKPPESQAPSGRGSLIRWRWCCWQAPGTGQLGNARARASGTWTWTD